MASRCSGKTTKGALGLVGAIGKHGRVYACAVAETLRRGSRSGEVRGVEIRQVRVRASMKCGEDEAKERKNGDTAVSSGHDEAPLMAAVTKMANRPSPWLEQSYKQVEGVE